MEINHFEEVWGAIANEDMVEGRMVRMTSHTFNNDYGSDTDLPAAMLPAAATDSPRSTYVVTFALDNRPTPYLDGIPSYTWALRGGWDQATNVPATVTLRMTHPSNQEGLTIPSGTHVLLFGVGTYTVPSGSYIYSADIRTPGCPLAVANTAEDGGATNAGKLKYATTNVVAEVVRYHTDGHLTFRINK